MDKTTGVMTALKSRPGSGSKKGVDLLGIVQKLTEKREAIKSTKKYGKGDMKYGYKTGHKK